MTHAKRDVRNTVERSDRAAVVAMQELREGNAQPVRLAKAARARLERIGVIDVGSNSVRLVVFDGMARTPAYYFNEKVLCGLGADLRETGRLSPGGWRRALAALHRFKALSDGIGVSGLIPVATAAVRDATDGPAFCKQVEHETGLQLRVASGREEAQLAAKGVLLGWPEARGFVCDMGGASVELARIVEGEIEENETAPIGPLRLVDVADGAERARAITQGVKTLRKSVGATGGNLYLVGGSWRAIARLDMERVDYPLKVLHGYAPPVEQLLETLEWLRDQDQAQLSDMTGTSAARMSLIPQASQVLAELVRRLEPERILISAYGLREGLLYRQMPEAMRARDPLIEVCRHMEAASARTPGFGDVMADWLAPIYASAGAAELRLVRAACLLHDINWRAHPDYRAELCFESVTRANVAGIEHDERVFLGLALMNRYKNAQATEYARLYGPLLSEQRRMEAVTLGRAMRLGAMLSGSVTAALRESQLTISEGVLTLALCGAPREFAGEAVDRRLQSLANKLDLTPEIKFGV